MASSGWPPCSCLSSAAIAEVAASVGLTVGGGWPAEQALADMDASGIAAAVLTPIIFVADMAQSPAPTA